MPLTKLHDYHLPDEFIETLTGMYGKYDQQLYILRMNQIKTNFMIDAMVNAGRNKMVNMVFDLFNDLSGVDQEKSSNYWYDSVERSVAAPVVTVGNTQDSTTTNCYVGKYSSYVYTMYQEWVPIVTGLVNTVSVIVTSKYGNPGNLIAEIYDNDDSTGRPGNFLGRAEIPQDQVIIGTFTHILFSQANIVVEQGRKYWLKLTCQNAVSAYYVLRGNISLTAYPDGDGYNVYNDNWNTKRDLTFQVSIIPLGSDPAEVVSIAEDTGVPPSRVFFTAEELTGSGSIAYYVSRDDGVTWTAAIKDGVTDISDQPPATRLRIKAVITGAAKLLAWSYAWS